MARPAMRGIDCVQLPTSLLAMVDSSVGGKTAVDIAQGKNLVGAFHPPRAVFADTKALRTLPPRELRAGFAEVIKYGAIVDPGFLDWLETNAASLLASDDALLAEAIARSCAHKAAIVERDPFEHGERALLNFGHTFAHAIETEQAAFVGYGGGVNHGEAVAIGMVLAAQLSSALGLATAADGDRLRALLQTFGLPVDIPAGLDPAALLAHMRLDKKAQGSGLRFILWDRTGAARIVAGVNEAAVLATLNLPASEFQLTWSPTENFAPMRMLLQQRPDGHEAPRFVQLQLQPDLLGGWTLLRETGQIGGRSTLRREQYPDQALAVAALESARDAQLKRGFQLMFAQGADAPR